MIVCAHSLVPSIKVLTCPVSFLRSAVVEALLRNEALTNIADNKGCYPLHLAAWKGDERIVKLLIHQGRSNPQINEQVCHSCVLVLLVTATFAVLFFDYRYFRLVWLEIEMKFFR